MQNPAASTRPFPIPVVAFGPGSQPEDETLDYLPMPQGMSTYQPPRLPEPAQLAGREGVLQVLQAALAALRGNGLRELALQALDADERQLLNQVLGEGEVSAQVLADPARPDAMQARIQETVYAGLWRVCTWRRDGELHDRLEVGPLPQLLLQAAREDAEAPRPDVMAPPPGVGNAPAVLAELAHQRQQPGPRDAAHVVNLSLLPVGPEDIAYIDHVLGTGRVLLLSRGYGNCRISNCRVTDTWRVVYYNSQDTVVLNTVEVTPQPEAACAAPEDLHDAAERLADVLQWLRRD